ncbi:MAG: asparagine synthase (glutamine-hydrolyzing) [Saprospiraceae bacterium]|nr:asparagine synthase (glutamine-hydrolyzing) [Saprospiraceae bacterium]
MTIPPVDLGVLDYFMTYGYTNPDKTIYQKIKKLSPAHTLTMQAGSGLKIERYWDIRFSPDFSVSEAEWEERIIDKLRESVKLRLVSDVPLGAFLSGGIDSGSVVALMASLMDQPVKTFSIGFADKEFNELPQAREVAKRYETDHHEMIVEPQSLDMLPLLVASYDEPFADTSAIPTYIVSKFARKHVTVALSGDGGDELFAGYEHYQKLMAIDSFHKWTGGSFVGINGFLHRHIPRKIKGNGLTYYLSRPRNSFAAYYGKWQESERSQAYLPKLWQELSGQQGETVKKQMLEKSLTKDFLSKMQEIDLRTWLTDDILTKVDRASMSNSLEVRVPILDHEFAELTFSIPSQFKIKGTTKKHIFKKAMRRLLPDSIISQPKRGFGVPLKSWFKQDLKDYFHDSLCSQDSELSQFFQSKFVEKLIADNSSGMRDLNQKLWPLVFLNEWLKGQKKKEFDNVLQR